MKVQVHSSLELTLNFFINTGVTEIFSFRLVLEKNTGKEILASSRLEFLEKFSANNFALSDTEDNNSGSLNEGGIADFLKNITSNSLNVTGAMFLGKHRLFCSISICKFGSFKDPFAMITSLPELYFRFRRFMLLVKTKSVISMNYNSSTSS